MSQGGRGQSDRLRQGVLVTTARLVNLAVGFPKVTALVLIGACGRIGFDVAAEGQADGGVDASEPIDAPSLGPDDYVVRFTFDTLEVTNRRYADESGTRFAVCPSDLQCGTVAGGVFAGAAFFDETTELRVTSEPALETSSAYTVSFWMNVDVNESVACPVSKLVGSADGNSWQLCVNAPDRWTTYASSTGATNDAQTTATATFDAWHHVALRWDGTRSRITIDGAVNADVAASSVMFDGQDVILGFDIDSGTKVDYFTGYLDELRIYGRALSDADVVQLATPP